MKKDNIMTIIIMTAVFALVGGLVYLGIKKKPSNRPTDKHGHALPANVSTAALDNLVDKTVPSFTLTDRNGKVYSPENLLGKKVILFFNEGLMCYPACWNQIAAFPKDSRFRDGNTIVLSVVVDSKEEWQKAIDQMPELAAADVVFDQGAVVSKKFNVLTTPSSMHYGSLPGHTYIVIDKRGIVRYVFDDLNMAIHNDELVKVVNNI